MSKALAKHLGIDVTVAAAAVSKLERLSGFHSEDNRLLAESASLVKSKMRNLKLDPSDTTAKELYHCLRTKLTEDSNKVMKLAGILDSEPNIRLGTLISLVELIDMPHEVWALRRSVAKDLLRRQPPRGLMRQLKYRSLESVLKREDVDELLAVVQFTESPSWQRNFYRGFLRLAPSDFEIRRIRLLAIKGKKWNQVTSPSSVTISRAAGAVALWPDAGKSSSRWLGSFLAAIDAVESLRLESFNLMISQTRPGFGRLAAKQMEAGVQPPAFITSLPISWRSINHHYGRLPKLTHPVLAEPYMQQIDLHKTSSAAAAAALFPSLRWWAENDYLGWSRGLHPISLNISDVALNHVIGKDYSHGFHYRFNLSFWDELISRYLHHQGVENFVLDQLNNKVAPAKRGVIQKDYFLEFEPEFQRA